MKLIRQGLERGMFMTFGEKVKNTLRKKKKNESAGTGQYGWCFI